MVMKSLVPWKRDEKKSDLARYSDDLMWQLRDRMNRYLDSFWRNPFDMDFFEENDIFSPRIDLSETDQEYTLIVDLPGMDDKDIDLSYSRNVLSISGKKEEEKEEKERHYHQIERYSGQFRRDIPLQENVDESKIEATFKNGVLTINLPKISDPFQKKKKISIIKK